MTRREAGVDSRFDNGFYAAGLRRCRGGKAETDAG